MRRGTKTFDELLAGRWYEAENGCHIWTGLKNEAGYGRIYAGYVHRLRYAHTFGPIAPQTWCLHTCHNPACINPYHLYLGDHADNMRDAVARGFKAGENHHLSKVSENQVIAIRRMYDAGFTPKIISLYFPLSVTHIAAIGRRRFWRHI